MRFDSGRGQNRTLRLLSALWPPVFAGEQDVGPPQGRDVGQELGLDGQAGGFRYTREVMHLSFCSSSSHPPNQFFAERNTGCNDDVAVLDARDVFSDQQRSRT